VRVKRLTEKDPKTSMQVLRDYIDWLPETGWGTLRELPKLGESTLRSLFERGAIGPSTTRKDLDHLRSAQKRANVAARHAGDWESRP
jgi:hypothetical protein